MQLKTQAQINFRLDEDTYCYVCGLIEGLKKRNQRIPTYRELFILGLDTFVRELKPREE